MPTGEKIIFAVEDNTAIVNVKSKYIAKVYISDSISTILTTDTTATLKVNPNAKGVGIFDLSTVLDNYVNVDYLGGGIGLSGSSNTSSFKGTDYSDNKPHDIHLIDDWSCNQNAVRYFTVEFYTEYADTISDPVVVDESMKLRSADYIIFNGYLDHSDTLNYHGADFGYNLDGVNLINQNTNDSLLTNAPVKQYARLNDYMTIAMFNNIREDNSSFDMALSGSFQSVSTIHIQFYYNQSTTGSALIYSNTGSNGGYYGHNGLSKTHIIYRGIGPANLTNTGVTLPANWDHYEFYIRDSAGNQISKKYVIHQQFDDCKGFETIRLCWVNKWGTWDYYNFTKKSTRTLDKKPSTYHQNYGTWNEKAYRAFGHKGGTKIVQSASTETITLNTDYITEEEATWLQELFLTHDVYILNQDSADDIMGYGRKYVEPVTITSTQYVKKTKANDKLIQYSIEIEKSKPKRAHRS